MIMFEVETSTKLERETNMYVRVEWKCACTVRNKIDKVLL